MIGLNDCKENKNILSDLLKNTAADNYDLMALYGKCSENLQSNDECRIFDLSNSTGIGVITMYNVLSGIKVVFNDIHMAYCNKNQTKSHNIIEINHCKEGRYECSTGNQSFCYMSPGDLAIGSLEREFKDSCFPTRHYHGISIFIELDKISDLLFEVMKLLNIDIMYIKELICDEKNFFIMRANESIEHIFSELYSIRDNRKAGFLKIKVLELLLFLSDLDRENSDLDREYLNTECVEKIKRIHNFIIDDIKKHYTIDELSDKFGISPTLLKRNFNKVYGQSIYAYLKSYRLQKSQELLLRTDMNISQIAYQIGYENPNKYSSAFKSEYGITPSNFRNSIRNRMNKY